MNWNIFKHLTKVAISALVVTSSALSAHSLKELNDININGDTGIWLYEQVDSKIPDTNFAIFFDFEQRFGSHFKVLWYHGYELGISYSLTEKLKEKLCTTDCDRIKITNFSIAFAYLQYNLIARTWDRPDVNFRWASFGSPRFDFNLSLSVSDWGISQRFRIEYDRNMHHQHVKSYGIFRYRIGLTAPWKWTCWNISPFVNNEFFFRNNTLGKTTVTNGITVAYGNVGGYYENRFRLGFVMDIPVWCKEKVNTAIFWQWRPVKKSPGAFTYKWAKTNQIGVNLDYVW